MLRWVNVLGPATALRVSLRFVPAAALRVALLSDRDGLVLRDAEGAGSREAVRLMLSAREMPVLERLLEDAARVSRSGSIDGTPDGVRGTAGADR